MKLKFLLFVIIFVPLLWLNPVHAQELSRVNVSELTDSQVMQLMNEITKLGLTMDEAANLARVRGASDEQIKAIMGRILDTNWEKELQDSTLRLEDDGSRPRGDEEDWYSSKEPVDTIVAKKKIFGFELFNSENLTFEPGVNIQTPKEYIIGIGDEFIINLWGASEAVYQ